MKALKGLMACRAQQHKAYRVDAGKGASPGINSILYSARLPEVKIWQIHFFEPARRKREATKITFGRRAMYIILFCGIVSLRQRVLGII